NIVKANSPRKLARSVLTRLANSRSAHANKLLGVQRWRARHEKRDPTKSRLSVRDCANQTTTELASLKMVWQDVRRGLGAELAMRRQQYLCGDPSSGDASKALGVLRQTTRTVRDSGGAKLEHIFGV